MDTTTDNEIRNLLSHPNIKSIFRIMMELGDLSGRLGREYDCDDVAECECSVHYPIRQAQRSLDALLKEVTDLLSN